VRPQNRPFQWSGKVIVTLRPAGSTQPVTASGWAGFCAAATQIVWLTLLTNVASRDPGGAAATAVSRHVRSLVRRIAILSAPSWSSRAVGCRRE
jgi:hypothetical protein